MSSTCSPPTGMYIPQNNLVRKIRLDCHYLATMSGIFKLIELVFVGIAFCCFRVGVFQRQMDDILDLDFRQYISAPKVYEYINSTQFYFYLLPIIFSVTKTLFVLFLFHVQDEYDKINWVRIEMVVYFGSFTGCMVCSYISYNICRLQNSYESQNPNISMLLSSIFGFLGGLAYSWDFACKFNKYAPSDGRSHLNGDDQIPVYQQSPTQFYSIQ